MIRFNIGWLIPQPAYFPEDIRDKIFGYCICPYVDSALFIIYSIQYTPVSNSSFITNTEIQNSLLLLTATQVRLKATLVLPMRGTIIT